jgi:hypothetical protein
MNLYKFIMTDSSSIFSRPLLIYDDKCSLCGKFAKVAFTLSRGWVRTAGHYYSEEAIEAKKSVFPSDYDATRMFWLINEDGAYGARSGLLLLVKEIFKGIFKQPEEEKDQNNYNVVCNCDEQMSCVSIRSTIKRIVNMIRNSGRFPFYN